VVSAAEGEIYRRRVSLLMSLYLTLMHTNSKSCLVRVTIYNNGHISGEIQREERVREWGIAIHFDDNVGNSDP
jgi:hypothetical protein